MAILLNNLEIVEWLWHDADIQWLLTSWSDSGGMAVSLRCEINPEESRQPLIDLGIKSPIVDVLFQNVWRLKTDLLGDMAAREVVLDWREFARSPLIEQIRANGAASDVALRHHQIKGSGGSTVDIVFEQILLAEVWPKMNVMLNALSGT